VQGYSITPHIEILGSMVFLAQSPDSLATRTL